MTNFSDPRMHPLDRARIATTHYPLEPGDRREAAHVAVRLQIRKTMEIIGASVPEGRERSLALTKLEEAMFWANAGIAREGRD